MTTAKRKIQIIVVMVAAAAFIIFLTQFQFQPRQSNNPPVEKKEKSPVIRHSQDELVNSPANSMGDAEIKPSIHLRKIEGIKPENISITQCRSEHSGYKMLLDKIPETRRFESWLNPRGDLVLINVYYSTSRKSSYRIHDTSARLVCYAPDRATLDGNEHLLSFWLWQDDRTLVGIMCHYKDADDTESADKVQIFAYTINPSKQSGELIPLETPEVPEGHVLRLDGVTKEGYLVLSDVFSGNDYPVRKFSFSNTQFRKTTFMGDEKFLGCFEIVKTN